MDPVRFGVSVLFSVGCIDGLEFVFPKTRRVHEVHNFPDLLGLSPQYARSCGVLRGALLAGYSGVLCALPLVVPGTLALMALGRVHPWAWATFPVMTAALLLLVCAQQLRLDPPLYQVHVATYVAFGALGLCTLVLGAFGEKH